jgi:hypothetical protein
MSTSGLVRPALLLGFVAVGCSAPVVDEEDIADASEGVTQGIVLVERLVSVGRDPAGELTNVSAKFMRLSGSADPELVERVVGSRLDLPATLPGCAVLGDDGAASLHGLGRVVLLDAGDEVLLRAGEQVLPLDRRAFPDVGGAVFGQFYTSRDASSELPAPARYVLESSGSVEMDRLVLAADGPAAPDDVRVADQPLGADLQLEAGQNAVVRWRTSSDARPDDVIYVDVGSAQSGAVVRCAFPDAGAGEGVVPGALLGAEALGPLPAALTVAVHRVRQHALGADGSAQEAGLDVGEMRFDLGVVGQGTLDAPAIDAR